MFYFSILTKINLKDFTDFGILTKKNFAHFDK